MMPSKYVKLNNIFGNLSAETTERIERYINSNFPTTDMWDDIHTIILRGDYGLGFTVWQAVIAVDPAFPTTGRVTDQQGNIITDWEKVPDAFTVRRALKYTGNLPLSIQKGAELRG